MSQTNPVKAIRDFCFDCCGKQRREVELCPSIKCALYAFRLGRNPYRQKVERNLTDQQREELRERIKKAQQARTKNEESRK